MIYVYPALFRPNDADGSITVTIPDLPGCITEGKDFEDAMDMTKDALEMWLWYAEEHKEEIPPPSEQLTAAAPEFVNLVYGDTNDYRSRNDSNSRAKRARVDQNESSTPTA